MAKLSMINRDLKRTKLVKKYAVIRAELKELIRNPLTEDAARDEALLKLQKLPRDSSASRQQSRCAITGRAHGVYRKFGLARNKLREITMRGDIPGLRKASW